MSRQKQWAILVLGAIVLTLSCNTLTPPAFEGPSVPGAGSDLDRRDTLFLVGSQPQTLDPATTRSGAGSPVGAIFSGLVTLDPTLQVQPELAAGWDVSDDGTVYTFYLRPEARFHDGRPVTAEDVIFSWERAANPATASDTARTYLGDIVGVRDVLAGQTERISGIRAIDDHTLEVRIDGAKAYFLPKLTYPAAFVVDRDNVSQPNWERKPNGTGPFTLKEWEDDEVLILARYEDYYRERPAVGHVVYRMGAGIPLSMYENDQIDLVGVGGGTLERARDPNDPLSQDLRSGVDMCTSYIVFNTRIPPFDDPLVRQAFSYALDRDRLIDGLFHGNALPAKGPLPPGMPGYSGDFPGYEFDPAEARELLVEAGYDEPGAIPTITYTTSGYGGVGGFVTAVITMWQENLGVTIEPILLEPYNYLDELYAGNVGNLFGSGWCADYPDPENFLDILYHSQSTQNLGGYSSPELDALLEQARTEPDSVVRMARYAEIERLIVEEAPAIYLSHSLSHVLVKPQLQDYVLTPLGVAQWHRVSLDR